MTQTQKEHDMFRSKPTVGSVCEGMCRALPFASLSPERHRLYRETITLSLGSPPVDEFFPRASKLIYTRNEQHIPEQTYRRISLWRNMLLVSLSLPYAFIEPHKTK